MRVLKIILEGVTTSFRYPHFMLSVQPSFPMPPPATIYGHLCSALGEWVDPAGLAFAYHFTAQGTAQDLEHVHVMSIATGKLPGSQLPKIQEGNVNPYQREMLFQPRLVLYLNRPEWLDAFRSPRYPVVLGRSQDLCWYRQVEVIDLQQVDDAYFEHTLLPYHMAVQARRGVVMMLPRWLDYTNNRAPVFARYVVVQQRVRTTDDDWLSFTQAPMMYWSDPGALLQDRLPLGLVFHTFTGATDEAIRLA